MLAVKPGRIAADMISVYGALPVNMFHSSELI